MPSPIPIYPGDVRGKWTVMRWVEDDPRPGRFYAVRCGCEDQTERTVAGVMLNNGKSRSCGCETTAAVIAASRRRGAGDLTGRVFGRLTVLSLVSGNSRRTRKWLCACSHEGNQVEVSESTLLSRPDDMSCGCLARERQQWQFQLDRHEKLLLKGPPMLDVDLIDGWKWEQSGGPA